MGHLDDTDLIEISPYFNGSISQLFLVKGQNSLIVKSLKPEYCGNAKLQARFINEVEIIRSAHSLSTPRLIKSNLNAKRPYFAYEYIDGDTLETLLAANTITPADCIDFTRQLLTILNALQNSDGAIIHSDISPGNVIISKQRQVHLIDFGCATQLDGSRDSTHTWVGKHAYLSPEQAQGHQWTIQSDLYQTGLLFYEMLTGIRRNKGITIRDMMPLAANPPPLQLHGMDKRYHEFISKLLSCDSDTRYRNANEVLLELNNT